MKTEGKIGIVTVLYRSESVLDDFMESLEAQTYRDIVLYVVNNASPDRSLEKIRLLGKKASFPVEVIDEPRNWGVAKGNNIGIRRALEQGCDYVLLSNNDVTLRPDTVEILLRGLEEEKADMAVPKIYFYDDPKRVWACGGTYHPFKGVTTQYGLHQTDDGNYGRRLECDYSPTCFMLMRSDVFSRNGMMDEAYFVYYDDTDFMYRAVRKKGMRLVVIPESVMWHKESVSTGGVMGDFAIRYLTRNKWYFVRKNYSFTKRYVTFAYMWLYSRLYLPLKFNRHQLDIYHAAEKEGRSMPLTAEEC